MKKKRVLLFIAASVFLSCWWYVSDYYRASGEAELFLKSTQDVKVLPIPEGFSFDGPGEEEALIFYPGGKVEYTAYAPLLYGLARDGLDCFLLKMPLNLAILDENKADRILQTYSYPEWYIGGHSLGGAAASMYAAGHDLDGLLLLAAYPTKKVDERTLEIYGSEDGVLNRSKREEGDRFLPEGSVIKVIDGGNHAQFGNYGEQKGDGSAGISGDEQQIITRNLILEFLNN